MANFTKPITVNGWVNLLAAMRAAGYLGGGAASYVKIFNPSATVLCYVHFTDSASANPATGTDGWPIGGAATAEAKTFVIDRSQNSSLDLGAIWLNTPSSLPINILATGS